MTRDEIKKQILKKEKVTMQFLRSLIVSIGLTLIFSFNFTAPSIIYEMVTDEDKVKLYKNVGLFFIESSKFDRLFVFPCLGAGLGCLITQIAKMRLKNFLILANLFFTSGTLLQFLFQNYFSILLARIIIGIGIGVVCSIVPTYLSLISPLEKRGFYCSLQQIALTSGFLISTICRYSFNNEKWKIPFFGTFIFSVFLFSLLPFINDPEVGEKKGKNLYQLFTTKEAFLSILTGLLLHLSQHLASINVIICYTDKIFQKNQTYHILFNIVQVLFTCVNGFFIDKFGRKQLLLLSIFVTFVALCFLSFKIWQFVFAFVYIAGFCIGLGPVIWYASAEIFPAEFVVAGISFLSLTNWIWGWIQPKLCLFLQGKMGEKAFLPFNVALGACFVYFLVWFKETRNRASDFQ